MSNSFRVFHQLFHSIFHIVEYVDENQRQLLPVSHLDSQDFLISLPINQQRKTTYTLCKRLDDILEC